MGPADAGVTVRNEVGGAALEGLAGAETAIGPIDPAASTPTLVPASRYTDPAFAAREVERMWPRAWQIACSTDHVSEPGDFFEYRVGPYSAVIVRDEQGTLRAYQNACRHRGTALCNGSGSGLADLECPYHRWRWDLAGQLRSVPSRKGFGSFRFSDFPLVPVQVTQWGPLVWVNFDMSAAPLEDWLGPMTEETAWAAMDEWRCEYAVTTHVAANWKTIADGFSETYHIQGLHPEMLASVDDVHAPQVVWGTASRSVQQYGVPSPRFKDGRTDQQVWDSYIVTQGERMGVKESCPVPEIPPHETVQSVIADRIRAHQAERGVDLTGYSDVQVMSLEQYNVFPNCTILLSPDLLSVMVARPGDAAEEGYFTLYNYRRAPSADAPRTKPVDVSLTTEQGKESSGLIIGQDLSVLERVQRGLRQPGFTSVVLSQEERRIINTHRMLEHYLGIEPSEMTGGPA
jgi:phenylpropionate dioxygenase-like ring-hydroxylating dioxygenase large terminal subunit